MKEEKACFFFIPSAPLGHEVEAGEAPIPRVRRDEQAPVELADGREVVGSALKCIP